MLLRTRTTNSNWIAHAGACIHRFNSYGGHECIGMSAQSAGKPEMMTDKVYACHTIADADTLPLVY